ncbi:MAG TPA: FAD-dependent oxidoreductase [Candidatus Dormibacteraeota bacterium]|nr:FAD-dependent oxidoreductase [Candidatus Dormibacteraeota bacterium]
MTWKTGGFEDTTRALIVGGGPAGDAVAAGLRDAGFAGEIVLVGAEPVLPYERPHLSKGYLRGTVPREKLGLRPAEQYPELQIELRLGERVVALGIERHSVALESGGTIPWDVLCIATGSSARRLPGYEKGIYLRELADADVLGPELLRRASINVIGAGFIGCEVAAAARLKRCPVHVYESLAQPLVRVVGDELGMYLAAVHRANGVDMHLGVETLPQLSAPVVVGIGSVPRTELAERAGLQVEQGIVVDELGRTSAPGVFAAGDVTRFWSPLYEARIRVEHFQTAQRQGFAVGRAMAGAGEPYDEVPWFWSDQYELNLQYVGAGLQWDEVVNRGELGSPPFTFFYRTQGHLVAAAGINDHHTVARARRVMQERARVTVDQLADPGFDLRRALA